VKRVVIVGGGISGLSAAYYLRRSRKDLDLVLLEARDRLGGVITTLQRDGFVVEGGPDSFIIQKPWALQLCHDLGIEQRLIAPDPANRKVYVLSRGRLEALPPGLMMGAPTRLGPFLKTRLISWPGKLRMAMDLILPRGAASQDESLGAFIRRRVGREALEKIADPILGGIHVSDADRLSLAMTFPKLRELERQHRSLILGMRRESAPQSVDTGSPFRTLLGGMAELVAALRDGLQGVDLRTNSPVEQVGRSLEVVTAAETIQADAIILALPPHAARDILRTGHPELAESMGAIRSVSTATVALAYRDADASVPLDATGFVIARGEGRRILACTWSSRKFTGRAPAGSLLVRCFLGGDGAEEVLRQSDAELAEIARQELVELMGLRTAPMLSVVYRWDKANPILEVGHPDRLQRIDRALQASRNLFVTGSGIRGVGIPDCVRDARNVARLLADRFS
jgi:protoporphyrinogen/coproporphyrinogen III oxidase